MRYCVITSALTLFLLCACNGSVQEVGKPAGEAAPVQPLEGSSAPAPETLPGESAGVPVEMPDSAAVEKPDGTPEKTDMKEQAR